MRPQLLTDEMILQAIREVGACGRVTGVRVRRVLAQRFGARGGVARVYRLIAASSAPALPSPLPVPPDAAATTLAAALERAALAEERELAHQSRWVRETEALKTRLASAEQAEREVQDLRLRMAQLRQALAGAQARIRQLEAAGGGAPQ